MTAVAVTTTIGANFNVLQMENSTANDSPWASQFTEQFDQFSGYVRDEISAYEPIKTYEIASTSRFTVFKQTGGFKDSSGKLKSMKHLTGGGWEVV